jgi:hypothetical protein
MQFSEDGNERKMDSDGNAFVLYDFAVSCNCEIEGGILIVDWMSMGCK